MVKKAATVAAWACLIALTLMAIASLIQVVQANTAPPVTTAIATNGNESNTGLSERSWMSIVLAVFAMFQAVLAYFVKSKLDSFMTKEACLTRMALCRHDELDPIHRQMEPLKETRAVLCVRLDTIESRLGKLEGAIETMNAKVDGMAHAISELRKWEG